MPEDAEAPRSWDSVLFLSSRPLPPLNAVASLPENFPGSAQSGSYTIVIRCWLGQPASTQSWGGGYLVKRILDIGFDHLSCRFHRSSKARGGGSCLWNQTGGRDAELRRSRDQAARLFDSLHAHLKSSHRSIVRVPSKGSRPKPADLFSMRVPRKAGR